MIPSLGIWRWVIVAVIIVGLFTAVSKIGYAWGFSAHNKKTAPVIKALTGERDQCYVKVGQYDERLTQLNNEKIIAAQESARREQQLLARLKEAEKKRSAALESARKLEAYRAKGATLCERMADADRFIMRERSQ